MKIENWNGHQIRFIEVNGEWCGTAKDISDALEYRDANSMVKKLNKKYFVYAKMAGMNQRYLALTEFGIYKAIFNSRKTEAQQFQEWVFNVIKQLRQSSGLEGFEAFRMMDKQHQKEAMRRLQTGVGGELKFNAIKANTIADKAVSTQYGYPKMIKKADMSPSMLLDREETLDATVELMKLKNKYHMDNLSVSQAIYDRQSNHHETA